jgi:hypothetical protein
MIRASHKRKRPGLAAGAFESLYRGHSAASLITPRSRATAAAGEACEAKHRKRARGGDGGTGH